MRRPRKRMCRQTSELASNKHLNRNHTHLSLSVDFSGQFERTETKFLSSVYRCVCRCCCRGFDERKHRIRELLPDSKIIRRNREPPESEHVTSRLGHVSHLLPGDFIDRQSFCPSERPNHHRSHYRSAGQASQAYRPWAVLHASAFRRRRGARRTLPAPALDYSALRSGRRPRVSSRVLPAV